MRPTTEAIAVPVDSLSPVLIVGGGPAGLVAALELRRFGIPVRIVDELLEPAHTSRAIGLQARTLEELELRGLADEFVSGGHRACAGEIYAEGKLLFHADFTRIPSRYNFVLFLAESETERILRKALAAQGAAVEWGVKMTAFGQNPSAVTATLKHAGGSLEEVRAAYVIDAEGAHSIIRDTLELQFKGKTLDETFALGDLEIESAISDTSFHIFSSQQGLLALFPMGAGRFRIVAGNPQTLSAPSQEPALEDLQALYDRRSHIPAKLRSLQASSLFHIQSRMVSNPRIGRIFLTGDAAHICSPAGAQGMNTGMQDAMNLGWKLALVLEGKAPESLLDTYGDDRVPVMRSILSRTEGLTNALGGPSALRSFFLHLAPWLGHAELVQQTATSYISQIALNYRSSMLSEDHFGDGSLVAGDRVPDLTVRGAQACAPHEACRLLHLLNASRFTLLMANFADSAAVRALFSGTSSSWKDLVDVVEIAPPQGDAGKPFSDAFGLRPSLTLVRPDAYIGFRGGESSAEALTKYGNRWLASSAQKQAA